MKKSSKLIRKEILNTIRYFQVFDYPPTVDEICFFLKKKTSKSYLMSILEKMAEKRLITVSSFVRTSGDKSVGKEKLQRYTLGEYSINNKIQSSNVKCQIKDRTTNNNVTMKQFSNFKNRLKISYKKIRKVKKYINILGNLPQIKLIGLSGSVAMMNADKDDDVDLFVITAKNRLWTGRFITLLIAQLRGLRRKRADNHQQFENKVCLNLFFDEKNLKIPKYKETEYVAHEILQMKPVVQKDGVYLRFLDANRWVFDIFPNARKNVKCQMLNVKSSSKFKHLNFVIYHLSFICNLSFVIWIFDKIESSLKSLQLYFINKHQTSEIITSTQLWFHPEDFGIKLK